MKRKLSKVLSVFLFVIMLFSVISIGCYATETYGAEIANGFCGAQGENVKWTFYGNGTLVFSGQGATEDNCEDSDDGMVSMGSAEYAEYPIENVVVAEGITRIGGAAFCGCYDIKTITLPDSLVEIGKHAFRDLDKLESIDIPSGVTVIPENCFSGCRSLKDVNMSDEATKIEHYAFAHCGLLESIELPDSVSYIGEGAFSGCGKLKEIYINENVEFVGKDAFYSCNELEGIVVSDENENYSSDDSGVLFDKNKTELIRYPQKNVNGIYVFPDTVKTISEFAFSASLYLKEVVLNDGLEEIGTAAFLECISLSDVTFPSSLKNIGYAAFLFCESFSDIVIPENVEQIGMQAFVCNFAESFTVKSMNANIDYYAIGCSDRDVIGISKEEYVERNIKAFEAEKYDMEEAERLWEELNGYIVYYDEIQLKGMLKCHEGSTAEAYAIENNMSYETIHFYGEWEYDWENYLRTRKCELCEMTETEALEKETEDNVEIIAPENPELDFDVDSIDKNNDTFVLVEQQIKENMAVENEVLKVFDITLKNKDGVHVQPDGTVKVKLPLDWEKDGNYKVYRVNDDGTLTDMKAFRQGSHMVFETDHFSIYVIVEEGAAEEEPSTEEENTQSGKKDVFLFLTRLIRALEKFLMTILELLGF